MRILIVAPAWIGDLVMTDTLLRALRGQHPDAQIHLLAPPSTRAVAERLEGIAGVHELRVGHGVLGLGERWRVARVLRQLRFDWAIILPNSLKSAVIPWLAGIPKRTGWLGEQRYGLLNDWRRLDPQALPLQIERFMALGRAPGNPFPGSPFPGSSFPANPWAPPYPQPRLRADPEQARAVAARFGLDLGRPVTILCPGAEYGPAKRWPPEHYAEVARHRLRGGSHVWLMGSGKDAAVCAQIVAGVGPGDSGLAELHALAGRTGMGEAIDLMSLAALVITNDSGLMHVAAALDVPLVAIYGSTSPDFTPPLSDKARVVRLALPCSPCFARECPLGHLDCLRTLLPAQVLAAT